MKKKDGNKSTFSKGNKFTYNNSSNEMIFKDSNPTSESDTSSLDELYTIKVRDEFMAMPKMRFKSTPPIKSIRKRSEDFIKEGELNQISSSLKTSSLVNN